MPLDFERLGDFLDQAGAPPEEAPSGDERRPVPRNKAGRIDFEAVWDPGSHASELATHRWKTLRNAEQTNTMPVMGAKGKTELVSPNKLIQKPKHPAKKDALSDYFGQDLAPGPSMAGNALKDVANMALAPADIAQLGVKGGINMLQGKWNKGGERLTLAAEKTGELAKGMLEYPIQAIGKTAGAVIDDMMPMLGPQLHKLGMSREDFNRAFHDNPLMMALTVVGGPSWLKEKITKAGGGGGGTPPGAFDEVAANEAMRDAKAAQEGHETAKKAQEQGRGAIEEDWREKMWRLALEAEQAKRDAQFGEEGRQAAWQAPTMYPTLDPATGEVRLRPQASPEGVVPEGVAASGQAMGEGLEPYPANTPQAPGYNKAQQAADLNTGAIESLDPNLPNNTQAWSMDTGFRPTNLLENQGIEPGLGYTESEATIRQLQAVDRLRRTKGGAYDPNDPTLSGFDEPPGAHQKHPPLNDREVAEKERVIKQVLDRAEKGRAQKKAKVEYDKAKAQYEAENEARADTHEQNRRDYANRKGKYRYDRSGERGSIDPQVFQDLYDLGAHVLRTARDYAGWALDMTKRIAKLPKEWLEELWKILRGKADESIERRTDPEQRANITQQIDDIRQAGLSHVTALDDIAARRAKGEIDGPTESRLIREANNQYSKALIGEPTPYEPSGGGLTQAELAELNEFQRLRDEKLKRSEGASFGPLPDEPKGPVIGSGLGGAQKLLDEFTLFGKGVRGKAVRLYHGTPTPGFRKFDLSKIGANMDNHGWYGKGVYLHTNPDVAHSYSLGTSAEPAGGIYPTYVALKKPFNFGVKESMNWPTPTDWKPAYDKLLNLDGWTPKERATLEHRSQSNYPFIAATSEHTIGLAVTSARLTEVLKANGYDGVIGPENTNGPGHEVVVFNPKQIKSAINKSVTLGTLGSQELYERTVNAATKVGKLIYRIANNFDDWSARVRFEAKRNGLDITDQQLREAWDSPEMAKVRPQETDQSVGSAAAEAVASGTEDTAASRWAGRPTWQSIRDAAANYLGDAKGQDWANATVNMFRDAWNSGLGTAPGFTRLHEYIPAAYEAATRVVTSYMDAFMRTRNHYNTLDTILETKGLRNSFADLINDDRARGLEASAQGRDARMDQIKNIEIPQAILEEDHRKVLTLESEFEELAETPKDHRVPKLDDQQRQLLLANPKIQAAIKYWTETMIPEIEGLSTDIGINRRFQGPLGLYSKMRWIDPFEELSHQFRDRELGRPQTSIGSGSPYDVRPKSPLSGKRATGLGPVGKTPENSLFHIIYNTYERRLAAKNLEAFRQTIRDNAIMKESENKGKFVQPFTEINGRKEPVKALTLERLSGVNEDIYHIPEMLKDVHDQIRGTRGRDALWKAFDKINNAATLQVVIMPAEAIRHGFNVIQVMTTIGQAKGFWSTPEAALSASTLGISRMANAMYKAFNLSGPEFAAQLRDMAEGGALRMRGYEGFDPRQKPLVTRLAEKVPGLHQLKDSVFGDPGTTKGLGGMETRLRAVLWNMLKEDQPGLGNAELGRQVNDAMGTYVSKMESPLARAFQGVDPFVRAGATLTKGGFRAAIGKDVTGRFNPNNLLAVYGTLLASQYYSKMLDDKGEWPWEKANWKPTQLLTFDRGGKRYSFSMSDVVNPLSRAANFSGARALVESVLNGETKGSNIAEDYIRGVNNAIRSRYGPIIRSIGILRKNELPYELSDGSMLPASSPSMAGSNVSPFAERMKALATSTLPVPSKLDPLRQAVMGQEELTGKEILPDSYLAKVFWKVNDIFKFPYVPTIHEQVNYKIPKAQYRTQNQYEDTLNDIVRRARNIPEDKRDEFITREILGKDGKGGRFTEELISVYGKSKPARWAALEEVYRRLAGREGAAAKGMARQQANTAR